VNEDPIQRAIDVKARHEADLMRKANVLSVGVGYRETRGRPTDEIVLVVSVTQKVPRSKLPPQDIVPPVIEGIPVDVREAGTMWAL
jgi:hypothetical protein